MGTKNNPGEYDCYENAEPDEPMFVLLARDESAPERVREWAGRRLIKELKTGIFRVDVLRKVDEALKCADAMEQWRKENR